MNRSSSRPPVLVALLIAACAPALLGCDVNTANQEAAPAGEATDSLESSSTEGALLAIASDGAAGTMTAEALATNAVTNAGMRFTPASCVTASATGAVATYKLDNCTGPYGLLHVTGTVTLRFSIANGAVNVAGSSKGLSANGATLNITSSGVLATTASAKKLSVSTSGTGTGTRGNDLKRDGTYTVTWDGSCITLDGAWATVAAGRTWTTTVSSYKRCTGMCPAAGGTLVYAGGISGLTMTITVAGDNTARWSTSTGKTGTVIIACGS